MHKHAELGPGRPDAQGMEPNVSVGRFLERTEEGRQTETMLEACVPAALVWPRTRSPLEFVLKLPPNRPQPTIHPAGSSLVQLDSVSPPPSWQLPMPPLIMPLSSLALLGIALCHCHPLLHLHRLAPPAQEASGGRRRRGVGRDEPHQRARPLESGGRLLQARILLGAAPPRGDRLHARARAVQQLLRWGRGGRGRQASGVSFRATVALPLWNEGLLGWKERSRGWTIARRGVIAALLQVAKLAESGCEEAESSAGRCGPVSPTAHSGAWEPCKSFAATEHWLLIGSGPLPAEPMHCTTSAGGASHTERFRQLRSLYMSGHPAGGRTLTSPSHL
jgi:hypothetical protein